MDKRIYFIVDDGVRSNRSHICQGIQHAPPGWKVTIEEPKRTLDQNAKLWPMLSDIAKQVIWYGNRLTQDEWKSVFSAALKKQKVVPGLDGGFVVCGQSTSRMSKREFSDMLELMHAFGAEHALQWSDSSQCHFDELHA